MGARKNILVAIYSHAEIYPPTLNAIHELAKIYAKVILVQRSNLKDEWKYPSNVIVISQGALINTRQQEQLPIVKKVSLFSGFTLTLLLNIWRFKPNTILLYDPLALFSHHSIRWLLPKDSIVWYHNHDVPEIREVRKYSITWFSIKAERKAFRYITIFSLPAEERLIRFPLSDFKGKWFVIPNYPSCFFYAQFYNKKKIENSIRLIFQGQVGGGHGLEEIVELLPLKVLGINLHLVIKGPCLDAYRRILEHRATQLGVEDRISFYGVSSYAEVPKISATCHIGLGIHAKSDFMNLTLGTASNKLYEYAAIGLPILYFNREHFTKRLSRYKWAIATELSQTSILAGIEKIVQNYEELSESSHMDFMNELNYEKYFSKVSDFLKDLKK